MSRPRSICTVFLFTLALSLASVAGAQQQPSSRPVIDATPAQARYPSKPIRFVVGFAAGGSTDMISRILGTRMSEILGQPITTENKPGADSLIACELVARAEPDGHTILITSGSHTINPAVYPDMKIDPLRDFSPISLIVDGPQFLIVNPAVPIHSVEELIAFAKKNPGSVNYATSASTTFLQMALFKSMAGIEMTSIPYKGAAPAVMSVLSNETQLAITGIINSISQVKANKVRVLAVTSEKRFPMFPDIPTVSEKSVPGYVASVWYGMFAPANVPPKIIATLSSTLHRVLREPDVQTQLLELGVDIVTNTPEEFATFLQKDLDKWAKVAKESGTK